MQPTLPTSHNTCFIRPGLEKAYATSPADLTTPPVMVTMANYKHASQSSVFPSSIQILISRQILLLLPLLRVQLSQNQQDPTKAGWS